MFFKKREGAHETISMNEIISPSRKGNTSFRHPKFFDLAEGSKDMISLGVGEPDFVTPERVRAGMCAGVERGRTTYTPNAGLVELREEIAEYLFTGFQVKYEPTNEVMVTVGGSEAIDLALRTLITASDEIIVPVPSYIAYSPLTSLSGGKVVEVETLCQEPF